MSKLVQIDCVVSFEAICDSINTIIYQQNKSRKMFYLLILWNEMQVI